MLQLNCYLLSGGQYRSTPSPIFPLKPTPQFWGVNRRFQAKLAKSKNVHIIKTTASIPTIFCTVIKTTKCPSWVVPTQALQIQDGGPPPSWKNRKIVISQPRFERFRRNLAWWCSSTPWGLPTVNNLKFQKSKMAAAAILKKSKSKIAISRPVFCYYAHSSVMDLWTRLWGRYHVSQNVFLALFISFLDFSATTKISITSMSVQFIVRPKCTLVASHAAPGESRYGTDRRTPETVTLRIPLWTRTV